MGTERVREALAGTRDPVTDRGRSPGPGQKPSPFAPRLCRVIPVTEPSITRLGAEALARVARFAVQHHREQVTVADLADHAGYSRHHFSRAFTATKSVSPSAYLTALRIESAKALLLTEDAPVIDIAMEIGFDSLSSFSRRFAATVGTPPARLRHPARHLEDSEPKPFTVADPRQMLVRIRPVLPEGVAGGRVWLGWYRSPAPIGLPTAGTLADLDEVVPLPLHPGAPWLLGFHVRPGAAPREVLAPTRLVVALHPAPVLAPGVIDLGFRFATLDDLPFPARASVTGATSPVSGRRWPAGHCASPGRISQSSKTQGPLTREAGCHDRTTALPLPAPHRCRPGIAFLEALGLTTAMVVRNRDDGSRVTHAQLNWRENGGVMLGSTRDDDPHYGPGICNVVVATMTTSTP